ncbi:sigma factor-like helix-turn-helix DNA-binding protein [Streptomyces cavernae]|uniref:sigma factor-like helix-turn-helix DNA-binding protein n=1 Tax=Streptomyces cavernae TaxID=2259034 RepID=UPI000FEBB618|nr:sigma factor-like helix-turn-helix DNA-binding protein [Streptomyces cavernae]
MLPTSHDFASHDFASEHLARSQDGRAQDGRSQDGNAQDGRSQDGNAQDGRSQDGTSHTFAVCARNRWPRLVVTAHLLADDLPAAEELVRRTLARVNAGWRRVPRNDVDFHMQRELVRTYLRGQRRPAARRAARWRVVLVLRYWEGRSEAETAQLLGCSTGALRAHAKRALKAAGTDPAGVRKSLARVAADVVPSVVPLDDLHKRAGAWRRRRTAVVATVCAAVLAPAAFFAVERIGDDGASGSSGTSSDMTSGPIRIVAPGERVKAAPGVEVWLTTDGEHWSEPGNPNNFRGISEDGFTETGARAQEEPVDHLRKPTGAEGADGAAPTAEAAEASEAAGKSEGSGKERADTGRPGLSVAGVNANPADGSHFLTGLYYGVDGDPGRVEVRAGGKKMTASVLTLAGSPGWGVWYVSAPLSAADAKLFLAAVEFGAAGGRGGAAGDGGGSVTVYDARGEVLARSGTGE